MTEEEDAVGEWEDLDMEATRVGNIMDLLPEARRTAEMDPVELVMLRVSCMPPHRRLIRRAAGTCARCGAVWCYCDQEVRR